MTYFTKITFPVRNTVQMEGSRGVLQIHIGSIKHSRTMSVARQLAGSDAVSALGKLAGATVGQVKSCSKLGTLLEATNCS